MSMRTVRRTAAATRSMIRAGILALAGLAWLACAPAARTETTQAVTTRAAKFEALYSELHAQRLSTDPNDVERFGQAAVKMRGKARLYGLWHVLYVHKSNQDEAAFNRWRDRTRRLGVAEHAPDLVAMADFMTQALALELGRSPAYAAQDWARWTQRGDPDVRLMAGLEQVRAVGHMRHWADATRLANQLLPRVEAQGDVARPLLAELHQTTSYALTEIGYVEGSLDHMRQAVQAGGDQIFFSQGVERVYDLAYTAAQLGEIDAARKFAAEHTRLVETSGAGDLKFWDRFLCGLVAQEAGEPRQVLDCLQPIQVEVDTPATSIAAHALRMRVLARAMLGQAHAARADLARLERTPRTVIWRDPHLAQLVNAYIDDAQGRRQAFAELDQWRRQETREVAARHTKALGEIGAALDAELQTKRAQSERLTREVDLGRRLNTAWTLAAGLLALLVIGGLTWAVHQRRLSRDLRQARARAEAASAAKSTFLATMSHELRTPLNAMLGLAQALILEPLEPGEREQVELLEDSGRTLLTLLNDVLDLAKIEAGKLDIAPIPGDLVHLCARVVRIHAPLAGEKGVEIALTVADGVPARLAFDPVRVRQCLSNLISNAVKFTPEGRIEVRLACDVGDDGQALVSITVTDTGVGMSPATLQRLFEAFVQADASTTRQFGGTGLGLNITRRLAQMMGGGVTAASREGLGSTFTLSFQARAVEDPRQAAATAAAHGPVRSDLRGLRILLVEDHPINRKVVRLMLAPYDCAIIEAENGQLALDALETANFDLVLMDVNMPVMDGLEATRRIRARPRWANLPIIGLTADAMEGQLSACHEAGMDSFVVKPIDMAALVAAIGQASLREAA
jgi:signal transduction histidine kinase/ActR/RegA family two-component response regulator